MGSHRGGREGECGEPRVSGGLRSAGALTVLAAAARVAREAPTGSGLGLAGSAVLTRRADLLAAEPPAALGTV